MTTRPVLQWPHNYHIASRWTSTLTIIQLLSDQKCGEKLISNDPDTTFKCNSSLHAVRLWKDKNYFSLRIFFTKTIDFDNDINVATYSLIVYHCRYISHLQNRHIIRCWWSPIDSTSAWWRKWSGPWSRSWPSPEKTEHLSNFENISSTELPDY